MSLPRNQDELLRANFVKDCEQLISELWDAFEDGLEVDFSVKIREKAFQSFKIDSTVDQPIELFKKKEVYSRNASLPDLIPGAHSILLRIDDDGKVFGYIRTVITKKSKQ